MSTTAARRVVAAAFDGYEFWKRDTELSYRAAAIALLAKGFGEDDAAEILSMCHAATASEFGS